MQMEQTPQIMPGQWSEYLAWYEFFITWGTLTPADAHAKAADLTTAGLPAFLKGDAVPTLVQGVEVDDVEDGEDDELLAAVA